MFLRRKGDKIDRILHKKGGIIFPGELAWVPTTRTSRDAGRTHNHGTPTTLST